MGGCVYTRPCATHPPHRVVWGPTGKQIIFGQKLGFSQQTTSIDNSAFLTAELTKWRDRVSCQLHACTCKCICWSICHSSLLFTKYFTCPYAIFLCLFQDKFPFQIALRINQKSRVYANCGLYRAFSETEPSLGAAYNRLSVETLALSIKSTNLS
jgi:hypothetical protein